VSETSKDIGVLTVLAQRLVDERLPRALALKKKVDQGETLEDRDIEFLEKVFNDARMIAPIVNQNPQYQDVAARMVQLYKEITEKALENQKAQGRS
jgi:hypothetical protein